MANEYATVDELRQALQIRTQADEDPLALALEAASRTVDDFCRRRFWADSVAVARYYDLSSRTGTVRVDDISTTTDLAIAADNNADGTYETAWDAADYVLLPRNAAADGEPWTEIGRAPAKTKAFPLGAGLVRVTARWGWPAVPKPIKQATLIEAARIYRRKDSPFGIASSAEFGGEARLMARLDPDVEKLVRPYRIIGV